MLYTKLALNPATHVAHTLGQRIAQRVRHGKLLSMIHDRLESCDVGRTMLLAFPRRFLVSAGVKAFDRSFCHVEGNTPRPSLFLGLRVHYDSRKVVEVEEPQRRQTVAEPLREVQVVVVERERILFACGPFMGEQIPNPKLVLERLP
jgi:hypothetical protein